MNLFSRLIFYRQTRDWCFSLLIWIVIAIWNLHLRKKKSYISQKDHSKTYFLEHHLSRSHASQLNPQKLYSFTPNNPLSDLRSSIAIYGMSGSNLCETLIRALSILSNSANSRILYIKMHLIQEYSIALWHIQENTARWSEGMGIVKGGQTNKGLGMGVGWVECRIEWEWIEHIDIQVRNKSTQERHLRRLMLFCLHQ